MKLFIANACGCKAGTWPNAYQYITLQSQQHVCVSWNCGLSGWSYERFITSSWKWTETTQTNLHRIG